MKASEPIHDVSSLAYTAWLQGTIRFLCALCAPSTFLPSSHKISGIPIQEKHSIIVSLFVKDKKIQFKQYTVEFCWVSGSWAILF